MTQEEKDLMTALSSGPVPEDQLGANAEAAYHLVGRNVTVFYPMADGSEGRQCELTDLGETYVKQAEELPPGQLPILPPPTITALTPSTAPANADVEVEITGSDFSGGVTVEIGTAYGLVPTTIMPTTISVVFEAINIEQPGTLPVKVKNGDDQYSNAVDFVVT